MAMSPEEFVKRLQDISMSDGIPYGRTRLITLEEQKYNSTVLQYKGHFALSNAFKCFFLETVELGPVNTNGYGYAILRTWKSPTPSIATSRRVCRHHAAT